MREIKFLVISDLHTGICHDDNLQSKLNINGSINDYGTSIIEFISSLSLKIDSLICCGDIANKGCIHSFQAGWKYINQLKSELNIPNLLCVPGNHDHQSRSDNIKNGFSPKHSLQFCQPSFPFEDFEKNTHFWAWNWTYVEHNNFNSFLLNTSAYHGYGEEYRHGRVAIDVSKQISDYISKSGKIQPKSFNLLLCHHHPEKMEHIDEDSDYEQMDGGQFLLKNLQELDVGPWFIIHGHKHFASISYASSSTNTPPTILSAGSLSAVLYDEIKNRTSNQFYIITINLDKTEESGRVVGTFNTYEFNKVKGWQPSKSNNLPAAGGFGSLITPQMIINKLSTLLDSRNTFIEGSELDEILTMIENYTPKELDSLIKKLEQNTYAISRDGNNKIIQIGFKNA